jgi:glycosyltransferase involved in cell wall biosynthesis
MKLHTVFITYNRLELTKRAIESYLETVEAELATYVVVDNASTDGTAEWLHRVFDDLPDYSHDPYLLTQNRYPGYATNLGWAAMPHDTTHLHRADNDFEFLPGWCSEVERMFARHKFLGQLGLRTDEEEQFNKNNVGGNCIVPRELWDQGLRWDERPWPQIRDEIGAGWTEDSLFSKAVRKTRAPVEEKIFYKWTRVERPCIRNLASGDWKDPYYQESYGIRGIRPRRDDHTVPKDWTGGYST